MCRAKKPKAAARVAVPANVADSAVAGAMKIFGLHAVRAALQRNEDDFTCLYAQSNRRDQRLQGVTDLARDRGVTIVQRSAAELSELVDGKHQGVVLELQAGTAPVLDETGIPAFLSGLESTALILVLDGVTDPHNLGACLRSADAAGVQLVLAPKDNAAGLNATVRKVACGAAESVPFVQVTNLARTLAQLKSAGIWLVGAAGEAEQLIYDVDLSGPVGIVMGAEGSGLRRLTREACDFLAKLPMSGTVESLNVSVATGICLFEAQRQRLN